MSDYETREDCDRIHTDHLKCDGCPERRTCGLDIDINLFNGYVNFYEQDDLEYYNDCEADDYRDEGNDE